MLPEYEISVSWVTGPFRDDHGGAAFLPENIDELITKIKERRTLAETPVVEKFRLGDGPFTAWLLFGIFAGALSSEWFLRRQWGLA